MLPAILGALPLLAKIPSAVSGLAGIFGFDEVANVAGEVDKVVKGIEEGTRPPLTAAETTAIQQLAFAHKEEMARIALQDKGLDIDIEKEYLKDRQGARDRDAKFIDAGKTNSRANWMIVGDVVGLLACLGVIWFGADTIPGEVRGILSTIAGIFGLGLRDAHQFEFGSSRGSKEKDQLISK